MNAKVYPVIIGVSVCLFVSCVFQAASNLGLSPKKEVFEIFSSAKISHVSISYLYTSKDFPPQEIRFTLRDKETIARLQRLFKIKSVEPYTLGVDPKIEFVYFDKKTVMTAGRLILAGVKESCFLLMTTGRRSEAVLSY